MKEVQLKSWTLALLHGMIDKLSLHTISNLVIQMQKVTYAQSSFGSPGERDNWQKDR